MAGNGAEQKKFSEKGYPEPVLSVYIGAGRGIWYQRLHGAAYSRAHSFIRGGAEAGCGLYSGAGLQGAEDGSPSLMLADRLEKGIELYESGASARLLMSGDHGRSEYDEVNTMKAFAVEQGVPSEAVFMDHAGFSTYDSIYRAKDVFQAEKIIVVSQEYHLSRALYIAERLGLDAYVLRRRIFPIKGQPIEACVKLRQGGRISCWHGCSPSRNFSVRRCRSAAMEI